MRTSKRAISSSESGRPVCLIATITKILLCDRLPDEVRLEPIAFFRVPGGDARYIHQESQAILPLY